jgi:hypothetical protein
VRFTGHEHSAPIQGESEFQYARSVSGRTSAAQTEDIQVTLREAAAGQAVPFKSEAEAKKFSKLVCHRAIMS